MANNNLFNKRAREEFDHHVTTVANGLLLLSGSGGAQQSGDFLTVSSDICGRVFECKTCNRQFSSFQALGGHRASHKRPRMMTTTAAGESVTLFPPPSSPPKPKTHECSICGLEFAIGQALGGHMRRHRAAAGNETVSSGGGGGGGSLALSPPAGGVPVVKKPSSGRRVLCLDLNLTPLENDRLEFFKFGKVA